MDPLVLSAILSLLAAVQFGAGTLFVKMGLRHMDSFSGALLSMFVSTLLYWAAAPWALRWEYWTSPALWVFVAIGVLRPVVSTNLAYQGTAILGPTLSATLASIAPLFAVVGAVLVLGEHVSLPTLVGVVGVVAGVVVLSGGKPEDRDWPWWAVGFPFGAAVIRSGAHVVARLGMDILPSPYFAGLVAYNVSTLVALASSRLRGGGRRLQLNRGGALWFALAGLSNAGAIICLNTALLKGKVVIVSPISSSYPVWTLLFSWLFYKQEVLSRRTLVGVGVIVASVAVITVFR